MFLFLPNNDELTVRAMAWGLLLLDLRKRKIPSPLMENFRKKPKLYTRAPFPESIVKLIVQAS